MAGTQLQPLHLGTPEGCQSYSKGAHCDVPEVGGRSQIPIQECLLPSKFTRRIQTDAQGSRIYCSHWRIVEGLTGLNWLAFLWSKVDNGIFADEMGLGNVHNVHCIAIFQI